MSRIEEFIKKGKLKKASISSEMILKELDVGKKDLEAAQGSFTAGNYKWATIQAYYAIFHTSRSKSLFIIKKTTRNHEMICINASIYRNNDIRKTNYWHSKSIIWKHDVKSLSCSI